MSDEVWMMSNRQPWPYALVEGLIRTKTRSAMVALPPVGATVYLHASKALWVLWRELLWVQELALDATRLPRGGIVGVGRVAEVGFTREVMPMEDLWYFKGRSPKRGYWSCADWKSIVFEDVRRLPFIPCRGAQTPTRKLPPELEAYLAKEWLDGG